VAKAQQQIPHPQTTRVRDDKNAFFRSLWSHALTNTHSADWWTDLKIGQYLITLTRHYDGLESRTT
jgi:hypothetical protein